METNVSKNDVKSVPEAIKENVDKTLNNKAALKPEDKAAIKQMFEKSITDYDSNVERIAAAFGEKLKSSDANIAKELSKMKGQSESRFVELKAQLSSCVGEIMVELDKRGLSSVSKETGLTRYAKDFENGFIMFNGKRLELATLFFGLALSKNSVIVCDETAEANKTTSYKDLFYNSTGKRYLKLAQKPSKLAQKDTKLVYLEDIEMIKVIGTDGSTLASYEAYENVPTVVAMLAAIEPFVKITVPVLDPSAKMARPAVQLEVLTGAFSHVYLKLIKHTVLNNTISVKNLLFDLAAAAAVTYSGTVGSLIGLVGPETYDYLMSDFKASSLLAKLNNT